MLGRNEDAIADYSRALELEPNSDALDIGRAALYSEVGNGAAAIEDLKRAQEPLSVDDPRQG